VLILVRPFGFDVGFDIDRGAVNIGERRVPRVWRGVV
jgi:hypothetical protein